MKAIDSAAELSREQFTARYFNRQPFVYKGAVKGTRSYSDWTPEYLKSIIGKKIVNVGHSKTGLYNVAIGERNQYVHIGFDEAMDLFTAGEETDKAYYLQQFSIFRHSPELVPDLDMPSLNTDSDNFSEINLWIGGSGCVTQLHFDRDHNFLVQIRGRKELILFSPQDSISLYPNPESKFVHVSQVELDNVDHDRFPLFREAQPWHCLLEPGDLLYMPPLWWHHVRSLDMSISVNYWWNRFDVLDGMGLDGVTTEQLCTKIRSFTDRGFSLAHKDDAGEMLFIKAVRNGYPRMVEAFLQLGIDPDSTSNIYYPGASALQVAMESGKPEIVALLLKYGADTAHELTDLSKKTVNQ